MGQKPKPPNYLTPAHAPRSNPTAAGSNGIDRMRQIPFVDSTIVASGFGSMRVLRQQAQATGGQEEARKREGGVIPIRRFAARDGYLKKARAIEFDV